MKSRVVAALLLGVVAASLTAIADTTYQAIPVAQNWSTTNAQLTALDDWSLVPGIVGYRGDNLTPGTGTDPQTLVAADDPGVVDNNPDTVDPNTFNTGGVAEFPGLANPVVALNGSGTADAPYLQFYVNTTGSTIARLSYRLRDIDGSIDNAAMPVAAHFRVGGAGAWTNIPFAFVADATTGPSLSGHETLVDVVLPVGAQNQSQLQIRIMTTNAVGNDEWVAIDDILISEPTPVPSLATFGIMLLAMTLVAWAVLSLRRRSPAAA
jgi:uncharacterized protein